VHLTGSRSYGIALLHATGSASHIEALQALAQTKGLSLDKDGLRLRAKVVASKTEADVYAALGLPFIEPELREGGDEIELALAGGGKSPTIGPSDYPPTMPRPSLRDDRPLVPTQPVEEKPSQFVSRPSR
jgi:DNA polymerase beta thumb